MGKITHEQREQALEREIQDEARRIVDEYVLANMTQWVDFAQAVYAEHGVIRVDCPIDVEEIPLSVPCGECDNGLDDDGESCGECYSGEIDIEIYEWWLVSHWLAHWLGRRGEVVLEGKYWGRQTTGQAIFVDGVIQEIARERIGL